MSYRNGFMAVCVGVGLGLGAGFIGLHFMKPESARELIHMVFSRSDADLVGFWRERYYQEAALRKDAEQRASRQCPESKKR